MSTASKVLKSEGEDARVLKEDVLSVAETERLVSEFLGKRRMTECLSMEDYSRLCGLQEALAEEAGLKKEEEED